MKKIPHIKYKTHLGKFEVLEKWEYIKYDEDGENGDDLEIHEGYLTNGANIPRVFWWVLSPFDPRYIEESTIHDYICDMGQYNRADEWLNQLLKDNTDIAGWHRIIFIASVKSWHFLAYQNAALLVRAKKRKWFKLLTKIKLKGKKITKTTISKYINKLSDIQRIIFKN